jgi:hypothetical protein
LKELIKKIDPDTSVKISGVKASIKLLRDLSLLFPHDGLEQKSISHFRKVLKQESIEDKGLNQLVSFVDQQSEQQLIDGLRVLRKPSFLSAGSFSTNPAMIFKTTSVPW